MIAKEDVDTAVIAFCKAVIKEPLLYFSESDLHVLLIEKLYEQIPVLKEKTFDTNVHRGKCSKTFYKTKLLHREYGGGDKKRIDIVIFNENDVKTINNPNLTIKHKNDYLKPLFAFELGTEKIGETVTKEHVISDFTKLQKATNCGYLLHIFRDTTRAPRGTRTREKTEEKLDNMKKIFSDEKLRSKQKVKVIAILLGSFRNE